MWLYEDAICYTACDGLVRLTKHDDFYDLSIRSGNGFKHYKIVAKDWDEAKQKSKDIIIDCFQSQVTGLKVEVTQLELFIHKIRHLDDDKQVVGS